MADRSVRVTLSANVAGFQAAMGQAQSSVDKLAASTEQAGKGDGLKTASASASGLADAAKKAETPVLSLGQSIVKASQTDGWKTASTGLMAFGATAMSVGVIAAKSFMDFDEAMSHVAATGDDAKKNIDSLTQAAIKAGAETKYSATDAANGIEELEKAGMSATDILAGGLSGALSLAATDQMSVADAATDTATALTQFNLKGSDATHVADLLAAGAGKAMGSVTDMAEALNNGGLVASQMGMSIEQTVGTLASFAQNGIVGAEAGTALKSMLQKLQNPSKEASAAMKEIGLQVYDAQGKFVGMTSVADQLQNGTKNLTQAQRDQAFATIFGSYAINAANVLYKEGGDGIKEWTAKVNDSGYAGKVAADKMNNLKGDIEQLKGSFETAMISMGSGANGPLRAVTQALTTLVNFMGQHTTTAQVIVGIATAIGGLALGAGTIMKIVSTLTSFKQAIDSLKESSTVFSALGEKTSGALGKIGTAAMVAAGAIAATRIAAQLLQADHQATTTAEWAKELQNMANSANGAYSNLNKMFTISHGELIKDQVNGLADAMQRISANSFGDRFAQGISKITGSSTAIGEAKTQLSGLDSSLAELAVNNMPQAQAAFQQLGQYIKASGLSADDVVKMFPSLSAQLQNVAQTTTGAALSNQELAQWMSGNVPLSVTYGQALQAAGISTALLTQKQGENAQTAAQQAQSLSDVVSAMDDLANAALKASGSEIGLAQAVADATTAVQKNGATTNLNTQAGRDNMKALNDIASSSLSLRDAMIAQGATTDEVNAKTQSARDSFVAAAQQMGMTSDQANQLADRYKLIPTNVSTNVTNNGTADASARQVQNVYARIQELPAEKQTEIISILNRQGIDAAQAALDAIQDKTVHIRVETTNYTISSSDGIPIANKATGGYISGPGTATSDSIPAWLSNGEYVLKASAVRAIGMDRLHYMNQTGNVPRFASGGQVRPTWDTVDRSVRYGSGSSPIVVQIPAENGQQIQQNFTTKVVRASDDLYPAAAILMRTATREARLVAHQ